jgi:hypothetical protein
MIAMLRRYPDIQSNKAGHDRRNWVDSDVPSVMSHIHDVNKGVAVRTSLNIEITRVQDGRLAPCASMSDNKLINGKVATQIHLQKRRVGM